MSPPQDPGTGRSPIFGLPAVSISCPRCGRLVAADALSCPRCALPLAETSTGSVPAAPATPAAAPPGPAEPPEPPVAGPPAPLPPAAPANPAGRDGGQGPPSTDVVTIANLARSGPSADDRTIVLDAVPGETAVLPGLRGGRPATGGPGPAGSGPHGTGQPGAGQHPSGPYAAQGPSSAPAGPPGYPAVTPLDPRHEVGPGAPSAPGPPGGALGALRAPLPPALQRGLSGRGSPVLLGALLLVVVAVLWIVVGTFISSGPPPVRPAEGAAAAVDTSGPRPIEGSTIRATATSVQKPDDGVTYGAVNTLDDRPTTAWNSRGKGVGTRLTYTFAGPVELASISVLNGYHKIGTSGRDLWALNERIRQLRVVTENDTFVWELPDTKERQTLTRDFGRTRTVRLQILSTYAGEKYQDVGLSEIGFTATG